MPRWTSISLAVGVVLVTLGTAAWGWAQGSPVPVVPQFQELPPPPAAQGPAMQPQGPQPGYQQPQPTYPQPTQPGYPPASNPQSPPPAYPQQTYPLPPRTNTQPTYPLSPPVTPQLQPRPTTPQPVAQAPFVLTPAEQAQLVQALHDWETANSGVKNYRCQFVRKQWDKTFNKMTEDKGEIRYSAPDHGLFSVEGDQPAKWIYDGRAIFEYKFPPKKGDPGTLVEHRLPPQLAGKPIADGPLPFLFGDTAARLNRRYFMKIVTPPSEVGKQVWIHAEPKFQQDLANFKYGEVVLNVKDRMPMAMRLSMANGDFTIYLLTGSVPNNLLDGIFGGDPFKPSLERGWKKETEDIPPPNAPPQAPAIGSRPPYGMTR